MTNDSPLPSTPYKALLRRMAIAVVVLLPFLALLVLLQNAEPDIQSWLEKKTEGYSRSDAFDGVANIAPTFTALFGATSIVAAGLILFRQKRYLFPLLIGPALGALAYLLPRGFSDPAWFSILSLLSIGMLVGTPVTAIWSLNEFNLSVIARPDRT